MAKVKFWKGTSASYSAITTKDSNTLYYLTDTGRIYVGSSLVGSKEQGTSNLTIGTTATTAAAGNHTHSTYLPLTGGTINGTLNIIHDPFAGTPSLRIGSGRYLELTGNNITLDMSADTGGWAGSFISLKSGSEATTAFGFYGDNQRLNYYYFGQHYSDPVAKLFPTSRLEIVKSGNINPAANNTYSLGTSSLVWANVYATKFTGALTGNVTGNCSGSSGSCTGNAATATTATNYASTGGIATALAGKLALTGGTMTGALTLSGAPTSNLHAATKKYVDDNKYTHPTGDGNLHVPATGTTNNGKVLTAGSTAGSLSWTSLPTLAKGTTTGSGNAVTDISVNGHTITLTKGTTFLTAHQSIKTINSVALTGSGNITLDTLGVAAKDHTHSYIPLSGSSAITGDLISNNYSSLGSASNPWDHIYGDTIHVDDYIDVYNDIRINGSSISSLFASSRHTHSTYIPKTLMSSKGDIIYASAANTPARLAAGTNGYYLKMVNGVPAWAAVSASWSGGTVTSGILPNANKTLNLGSNSLRWNNAYIHSMQIDSIYDEQGSANIQFTSNNEIEFNGFGFTFYDDVHVEDYYVYADGFEQTSDRTLKTELSDVRLTLEQICSLPSKRFYFTKDDAQRPRVGTYAQDVQRILPEVVGQAKSGTLTLDYSTLGTVIGLSLADEVRKLRERVADLEARLK